MTESAPATDRRRAYLPVVTLIVCAALAALLGSVTWLTAPSTLHAYGACPWLSSHGK